MADGQPGRRALGGGLYAAKAFQQQGRRAGDHGRSAGGAAEGAFASASAGDG
jgi:hypothetical protein